QPLAERIWQSVEGIIYERPSRPSTIFIPCCVLAWPAQRVFTIPAMAAEYLLSLSLNKGRSFLQGTEGHKYHKGYFAECQRECVDHSNELWLQLLIEVSSTPCLFT